MSRLHLLLVTVLISASIMGCTTTSSLREKLDSRLPCCKSMADFPFEPITPGTKTPVILNDESPVFNFETGKSYFKAFSLSETAQGKLVRVLSKPTGSIAFETQKFSQSFCARALFLDVNFNVLSASDSIPDYARGFWSSAFVSQFEAPKHARYLVLHTNPKNYDQSAIRFTGGGGYMVGNTFVLQRGGEAIYHPCGPVADASVEIL